MYVLFSVASGYTCPTWFFYSNSTQQCECGRNYSYYLSCNQQTMEVQVKSGYCVTSGQDGVFYAGISPLWYKVNNTNRLFSDLPSDPELLEGAMCGAYNRRGCGECIDGYGPGVYTLDMMCADCSQLSMGSAICLYLLVTFVPSILCFILVLIFRVGICPVLPGIFSSS